MIEKNSYIKINRQLLTNEQYIKSFIKKPQMFLLYSYMLEKASITERSVNIYSDNVTLDAGQLIATHRNIADDLKIKTTTVHRYIDELKKLNLINVKTRKNKYMIITIDISGFKAGERDEQKKRNTVDTVESIATTEVQTNAQKKVVHRQQKWNTDFKKSEHCFNAETVENTQVEDIGNKKMEHCFQKNGTSYNKNNNIYIYSANFEDDFNEIWKQYPNKKGKQGSKRHVKKLLKEYSKDDIIKSIKKYMDYVAEQRQKGFTTLQYKNGDTFFRTGIYDYIDDLEEVEEVDNNNSGVVKVETAEEREARYKRYLENVKG